MRLPALVVHSPSSQVTGGQYVMPHFQGSLASLEASQAWSEDIKGKLQEQRAKAMERAKQDYVGSR
jgi:hypothetical protein